MNDLNCIKSLIRTVSDFPKPGILYYDISTVLQDARGFKAAGSLLEAKAKDLEFDSVAGIDSRGFIFGAVLAERLEKGLILIRKSGKLPGVTHKIEYRLEYGIDSLEICDGAVSCGQKILLVDDLLATGGTAAAACSLIESCGGEIVKALFLVELKELNGRKALLHRECESVLIY